MVIVHLTGEIAKQKAIQAVRDCPYGMVMQIRKATRNLDQSAKFHAMCGDLAKSNVEWAGKRRTLGQWKVLMISAHAVATKESEPEIVLGVEGEFVNIREESSKMSVGRASSLIEYVLAFGAEYEIKWSAHG